MSHVDLVAIRSLLESMQDVLFSHHMDTTADGRPRIAYTPCMYDLIDKDLDMDEDYHALYMEKFNQSLRQLLVAAIRTHNMQKTGDLARGCQVEVYKMLSREQRVLHESVDMAPSPDGRLEIVTRAWQ